MIAVFLAPWQLRIEQKEHEGRAPPGTRARPRCMVFSVRGYAGPARTRAVQSDESQCSSDVDCRLLVGQGGAQQICITTLDMVLHSMPKGSGPYVLERHEDPGID